MQEPQRDEFKLQKAQVFNKVAKEIKKDDDSEEEKEENRLKRKRSRPLNRNSQCDRKIVSRRHSTRCGRGGGGKGERVERR